MKNATLVSVEGIDGSGKTTAAGELTGALTARGHSVTWHANRPFAPVRRALDALAREEGFGDRIEMFGADFAQLVSTVCKWRDLLPLHAELARTDHCVIIDRYVHAQYAIARAFGTANEPLVRRLYASFPEPDVVVYLDVDAATATERVRRRPDDTHTRAFLESFGAAFRSLPEFAGFTVVDATQPLDVVRAQVWAAVEQVLARGTGPRSTPQPAGAEAA
ncbi:thymidylate kinase [Catellatospora sp. NPDC049111]|uniref:dTMP kinase n=1 Tax=Catellatospora sp. NPDC049111 TaxID=3155271 RepID=UPI0033FB7211